MNKLDLPTKSNSRTAHTNNEEIYSHCFLELARLFKDEKTLSTFHLEAEASLTLKTTLPSPTHRWETPPDNFPSISQSL